MLTHKLLLVILKFLPLGLHTFLSRIELLPKFVHLLLLISNRVRESIQPMVFALHVLFQLVVPLLSMREPLFQFTQLPLFFFQVSLELALLGSNMLLQRLKVTIYLLRLTLVLCCLLLESSLFIDLLFNILAQSLRILF